MSGKSLKPLAKVEHAPDQHEFSEDQGLSDGKAEWRKGDAMGLQNCSFEIGEGGKADAEIGRNDGKFLRFIRYPLFDRRFCRAGAFHLSPPAARSSGPSDNFLSLVVGLAVAAQRGGLRAGIELLQPG